MPLDGLSLAFLVTHGIILGVGLCLNLVVVVPNIGSLRKIAPSSFLVFWLCLFDVFAIANNLYITVQALLEGGIDNTPLLCQVHAFISVFGNTTSLLLCFGLTLFRYLIVVQQLNPPTFFASFYFLGILCLAAVIAALPFMLQTTQTYILRPSSIYCGVQWSQHDLRSGVLIWFCFIVIAVTLGSIVFAYAAMIGKVRQVFSKVKEHTRESGLKASEQGEVKNVIESRSATDGSFITVSRKTLEKTDMDTRQAQLMKQSIMVVGAFLTGWTPYIIMALWEYASGTQASPVFDFVSTVVVGLYEAVNPIIILVFDRDLRANCDRILLGRK
ncbi:hypothetical protein HDU78_010173 [Chytriomyces hyalinus]|nr:hypothetical protein HDU78_010173 [Chytriomyces hyalinus]